MSTSNAELKEAIVEIWDTAQNAGGSRGGMSDALDAIQELCSDVVPNVEQLATTLESESEEEDEIE